MKALRKKGSVGLDVGAVFLTTDHHFYSFDWKRLRQKEGLGHVILPNHFLQLLRPFIPVTDDFDRRFAETFAIPEFRTAGSNYATTCSKVLQFLATYADIGEETAVRILANEILLQRLRNADVDSPEFREVIESELIKDNRALIEENERLIASLGVVERSAAGEAKQREEKELLLARHEELLREERAMAQHQAIELREREQAQAQAARLIEIEREAAAEATRLLGEERKAAIEARSERDAARSAVKVIVGALVFLAGTAFVLGLYYWQWCPWLDRHTHKLGIVFALWLMVVSASWGIAGNKRRAVAWTALGMGAVLALIQIL